MNIVQIIKEEVQKAVLALYPKNIETNVIIINDTIPDFEGDYTLVTFSLSKN